MLLRVIAAHYRLLRQRNVSQGSVKYLDLNAFQPQQQLFSERSVYTHLNSSEICMHSCEKFINR